MGGSDVPHFLLKGEPMKGLLVYVILICTLITPAFADQKEAEKLMKELDVLCLDISKPYLNGAEIKFFTRQIDESGLNISELNRKIHTTLWNRFKEKNGRAPNIHESVTMTRGCPILHSKSIQSVQMTLFEMIESGEFNGFDRVKEEAEMWKIVAETECLDIDTSEEK